MSSKRHIELEPWPGRPEEYGGVKSVLVSSGGARAVGFRAAAHFTTAFRGLTGMTPTKYRTLKASEAPES